jgi:hypothetical protein
MLAHPRTGGRPPRRCPRPCSELPSRQPRSSPQPQSSADAQGRLSRRLTTAAGTATSATAPVCMRAPAEVSECPNIAGDNTAAWHPRTPDIRMTREGPEVDGACDCERVCCYRTGRAGPRRGVTGYPQEAYIISRQNDVESPDLARTDRHVCTGRGAWARPTAVGEDRDGGVLSPAQVRSRGC